MRKPLLLHLLLHRAFCLAAHLPSDSCHFISRLLSLFPSSEKSLARRVGGAVHGLRLQLTAIFGFRGCAAAVSTLVLKPPHRQPRNFSSSLYGPNTNPLCPDAFSAATLCRRLSFLTFRRHHNLHHGARTTLPTGTAESFSPPAGLGEGLDPAVPPEAQHSEDERAEQSAFFYTLRFSIAQHH